MKSIVELKCLSRNEQQLIARLEAFGSLTPALLAELGYSGDQVSSDNLRNDMSRLNAKLAKVAPDCMLVKHERATIAEGKLGVIIFARDLPNE